MRTGTKLAAFGAVLAAMFGGGLALGAVAGPINVGSGESHDDAHDPGVAEGGYQLSLDQSTLPAGSPTVLTFRIVDEQGVALRRFDELHERQLHLIILSRNLIDYLHVHPSMDAAGQWSVDVPALAAGSYRVYADFQPEGGSNLTATADLVAPGPVTASQVPEPSGIAIVDGYEVTLSGTAAIGDSELSFTVALDGEAVDAEPYLGASGHLVAIRAEDLAFLHVHPHDDSGSAGVTFTAELPAAGTYRLFFDFAHGGEVRTAAFTIEVGHGH